MKFPKPIVDEKSAEVYAVIETPKGCRNKYDYDPKSGMYELSKVLPAGTAFPLDFGFIPRTLAEDGDPLDILVISDIPGYTGTLIKCRVIGIIEAMQKEHGEKAVRNDRVLAVQSVSLDHSDIRNIKDVDKNMLKELVHFFEYYNDLAGKKFTLIGTRGTKEAMQLIRRHAKQYKE